MRGYVERTIVSVAEILRGDLYRTAYVHHLECGHEFEREVKMEGTLLCPSCREQPKLAGGDLDPCLFDQPTWRHPDERWPRYKWTYMRGVTLDDFGQLAQAQKMVAPFDPWLGVSSQGYATCVVAIWGEIRTQGNFWSGPWNAWDLSHRELERVRDKVAEQGLLK